MSKADKIVAVVCQIAAAAGTVAGAHHLNSGNLATAAWFFGAAAVLAYLWKSGLRQ